MVVFSAVAHVGLLGLVLASPGDRGVTRPQAISVELVSLPPGGAPKPPARPAAKPAPPEREPEPVAVPEPEPPPPPKPKEVVLPARPQGPKPDPKPEPAPRRREVFIEPKPSKEEKSLEDLLSEMREDAGEAAPAPAEAVETAVADAPGAASGGAGQVVSREVLEWVARAKRHVRRAWVVPPGFRTEPLETHVVVTLDARGNVIGTPEVSRRSGNPWFDDGVVRGIQKASPLPPPPDPGEWDFIFVPQDSL